MPHDLELIFPGLTTSTYRITSPQTDQYNCIAFAAGDTNLWWWPEYNGYWPDNIPRQRTLKNFVLAFQTLGYSPCEHGDLEVGFEKVAIYVDAADRPTHMARQIESGIWISKCGTLEDIEHATLEALCGGSYGHVAQFLKRSRK